MNSEKAQKLARFCATVLQLLASEGDETMQVKSFLATMGVGIAVGALGAMMLPKNSGVYQTMNNAAKTIQQEAEKAVSAVTSSN